MSAYTAIRHPAAAGVLVIPGVASRCQVLTYSKDTGMRYDPLLCADERAEIELAARRYLRAKHPMALRAVGSVLKSGGLWCDYDSTGDEDTLPSVDETTAEEHTGVVYIPATFDVYIYGLFCRGNYWNETLMYGAGTVEFSVRSWNLGVHK